MVAFLLFMLKLQQYCRFKGVAHCCSPVKNMKYVSTHLNFDVNY